MSYYLPFFSVSVAHDYFDGSRCSCLDFVPTMSTERLINNAGLLLRNTVDGIGVAYDETKLEALQQFALDPDDSLCLEFKVYSRSPDFRSYTEPFSAKSIKRGELLYLGTDYYCTGVDGGIKLHAGDFVSADDMVTVEALQLDEVLDRQDRLVPPVFVLKLVLNGNEHTFFDDQVKPIGRQCHIHFKTRQTVWKYFVLGKSVKDGIYITDADEQMEFEPAIKTTLAGQRVAMTIRSKQSIPLNERYDFRFQLKEKGMGEDKVCIKRLPVARISQVGNKVSAEQDVVVSEIYVNS